jgi:hypothetical protein
MARNESLAVLHATLDFRRIIDVPGYDRIVLAPCTRFIATMNYGYAGTRELNEALASRFMVINMPVISGENLRKLLKEQYPALKDSYAGQLSDLFEDIRGKCESAEISTKALDLRGLMAAVSLTERGLTLGQALELGLVNKSFDDFERQLVADMIRLRVDGELSADEGETEFSHIPDWYEWERANVRREVEEGRYSSGELPVTVDTLPNAKRFIRLGEGTMVQYPNLRI